MSHSSAGRTAPPQAAAVALPGPATQTSHGWLATAALVFVAWVFLHLPITDVMTWLLDRLGFPAYELLLNMVVIVNGTAALLWVGWRERWRLPALTSMVGVLLVFVAVAHGALMVAPVEYVHFPQYALMTYLLGRAGIPLEAAWLTATGLGTVDEWHQFALMPRLRLDYFDWNDVVLNGIGAAFGIVTLLAGRDARPPLTFSWRVLPVALAAACAIALVAGSVSISPYLTTTPRGHQFRVLSAFEAAALGGLLWATVRRLIRQPASWNHRLPGGGP